MVYCMLSCEFPLAQANYLISTAFKPHAVRDFELSKKTEEYCEDLEQKVEDDLSNDSHPNSHCTIQRALLLTSSEGQRGKSTYLSHRRRQCPQ